MTRNITLEDALRMMRKMQSGGGGGGGIAQETDPTVPAWAKQPNKPTYTANEVGALPNTTKIPAKTSDLTNDSEYVTDSELTAKGYAKQSEVDGLSEEIADLKDTAGKTAYEYALDGGYVGSEEDFAEALANVGNTLNENLFSFENADAYMAMLSKNKPDQNYIAAQDSTCGYKDTTNGRFVFPAGAYNYGIVGGLELPLSAGSYNVSADIYIPSANTTKTLVKFGVFLAPSQYTTNITEVDLGVQDAWITVSKVITVEENDTHLYPVATNARESTGTYEFYVRNIKVSKINADEEQGESIAVKKWVVLGDSITEKNAKTLKNYHDYIAELTGINVINMGLSGTGYKSYEDTNNAFYQRILNVPTNADVVTIFGSGNDLGGNYTIGNATDTGTDTLCGCINKTIDNLYSVLPTVQLGIITPNPWGSFNPSNENNLMAQYSAKIVEICKLRGIPCLDLYHCSGLRPWDSAFLERAYPMNEAGTARDTIHPNEVGHSIIAPRIKAFLESLIM